jgi:uncharacterized protein YndB with AHSA1/START domain
VTSVTKRPGDAAKVTVVVAVDPDAAFEVFTREIDLWWKRGPKYRNSGRLPGVLHFEPGVGGRLFESYGDAADAKLTEIGRVTAWEPPARLAIEWRNKNFAPEERTEVEVRFEAVPGGTRVVLEHRGWAALRDDHPARHGHVGPAFTMMMGSWWGELLTSMREHVLGKTGS